jgi:hypothetical protein
MTLLTMQFLCRARTIHDHFWTGMTWALDTVRVLALHSDQTLVYTHCEVQCTAPLYDIKPNRKWAKFWRLYFWRNYLQYSGQLLQCILSSWKTENYKVSLNLIF